MADFSVSIVILTFDRPGSICRNIQELAHELGEEIEIIVVDNFSEIPAEQILESKRNLKVIRLTQNIGVAARNVGIMRASSDIVVTLDDDVFGLKVDHLKILVRQFETNNKLGVVNFKVIDDVLEEQVNWCHHRKISEWGGKEFLTYEISEGAAAIRKEAFLRSGMYPEYFFISHEGPDLAIRVMDLGYDVIYTPDVVVRHAHASEGRPSWRRYYYDSRNLIWLSVRCYPISLIAKKVPIGLFSMLFYSIRDGYFLYWARGLRDAITKIHDVIGDRAPASKSTIKRYKEIERHHPSIFYMIKRRIFQKSIKI